MKVSHLLVLSVLMGSILFWGARSHTVLAQQLVGKDAEFKAAKYPPDIHQETLSRMTLPKREDFENEEEKQAWDRSFKKDPTLFDRFHSTAHRMKLPIVGEHYRESLYWLRSPAAPLEANLKVLANMVATRECENYIEYPGSPKELSAETIDVVKNKKDPSGLPEKEQVVIRLIREMLSGKKVASKTYADGVKLFGERGVLTIASFAMYYQANATLFRLYNKQLLPGKEPPFPLTSMP